MNVFEEGSHNKRAFRRIQSLKYSSVSREFAAAGRRASATLQEGNRCIPWSWSSLCVDTLVSPLQCCLSILGLLCAEGYDEVVAHTWCIQINVPTIVAIPRISPQGYRSIRHTQVSSASVTS